MSENHLPGELIHLGVAGVGMCISSPAIATIVGIGAAVGLVVWLTQEPSATPQEPSDKK
jgi:hypothetical protein